MAFAAKLDAEEISVDSVDETMDSGFASKIKLFLS